jgi:hypothetical protein
MNTYISPIPAVWAGIASSLKEFWEVNLNSIGPEPPCLVLAGWNFSDDYGKMNTWLACLKWAEERNCSNLIPDIPEKYWYQKESLRKFKSIEEDFGIYVKFHKASKKLSKEERNYQFNLLKQKWNETIGDEYLQQGLLVKTVKRLIVKLNIQNSQKSENNQFKGICQLNINKLFEGHTIYEIDFK